LVLVAARQRSQAQWLQAYGQYTFTIEGHADERGTRAIVPPHPTKQ
jgi:hypothetical protein